VPAVRTTGFPHAPVAPSWPTGIALGIGGLAGGYTGARLQSRLPDALIRRLVGVLVIAIGVRYLWSAWADHYGSRARGRTAPGKLGPEVRARRMLRLTGGRAASAVSGRSSWPRR
jgi:Sulfite exporter TauE/SafE